MIRLSCPWCDDEQPLDLDTDVREFRCEECGTVVLLADGREPLDMELAA
jgi:hypothetical protein